MKIKTYSKVNYTLEVGAKREDGYHNLQSVVQTLDLCDYIDIEIVGDEKNSNISVRNNNLGLSYLYPSLKPRTSAGAGFNGPLYQKGRYQTTKPQINISCSDVTVPTNEKNTVCKACELFLSRFNIDKGLNIYIDKNIPSQAGLGGGSGNASGILIALNDIFQTNLSQEALADMSAEIGSDCPLFIYGGTTLMTGRGETVHPLQPFPKLYFIIIKPEWAVSTKEAYGELDKRENIISKGFTKKLVSLQENKELTKELLSAYMTNDFEILNKLEIFDLKMALINEGAKGALLCGSGSCVFGAFFEENKRNMAFEKLKNYYKVYKAESVF